MKTLPMQDMIVREAEEPDGEFAKLISDEMKTSAIARVHPYRTRDKKHERQFHNRLLRNCLSLKMKKMQPHCMFKIIK